MKNKYREIFDEWVNNEKLISDSERELCEDFCFYLDNKDDELHNMASCMLSILDYLKLQDRCDNIEDDMLAMNNETLSEMMFRKMKAYNIDLNKELGFDHLSPVKKN